MKRHTSAVIDYQTTDNQLSVTVKLPHLRYLDQFIQMRCAPDLLSYGFFPNAKEITESMACIRALRFLPVDRKDSNVTAFVVGDGRHPRTGTLFAFCTAWQVYSIDPLLKDSKESCAQIERLHLVQSKIENLSPFCAFTAVIVLPHAHVQLADCLKTIHATQARHVIAIPCCVPIKSDIPPAKTYEDWGIHSPERTVMIWRNI